MEEKKSLNNKYQKIDIDAVEPVSEEAEPKTEKSKKEKKVKESKPPKEKKVKEPKPPKEKKVKEPKVPKEKKIKEPKPPKEKKQKKKKWQEVIVEDCVAETENQQVEIAEEFVDTVVTEAVVEQPTNVRRTEEVEIVLPKVKSVKKVKQPKEKKVKESKPPKEKKVKEPKPPKTKKVKAEKPSKIEKTPKLPKEPKEKKPREPLTVKDFITMGIAVVALVMVIGFVAVKFIPDSDIQTDFTETTTEATGDKLSSVQVIRDGISLNLIQSDISDVFYGFSTDYELRYYQYVNDKMVAVQSTSSVKTSVDLGNETIPVTIDYVELGEDIFGVGLFVADKGEKVYFYDTVAFRLVNLPDAFAQKGKALLLATTNKSALTQKVTLWPESFVVDLETGKTTRFLKVINRNIDMTTGAGVEDFCILTKEGYSSTGNIPFITAREYEANSGKQDIFIKNGSKEELYVSDIYGKYLLTDGKSVIYMKQTNTGFDVIRKTGEEEKTVLSLFGSMASDYIYTNEYIFNKNDGKLYNLKTGESKTLVGYRMSTEMMAVSPDGKYLVMLGTVANMMDYQVHIFNLETGEYTKFEDDNYSNHSNLTFINNTTVVYMVLDPNQGYEYVVLDVTKVK